jgi:hypothetical protein
MLADRDVIGLPLREVFSGQDLDQLVKLVRASADDGQAVTSAPMKAHLAEDSDASDTRFIHTIVPIMDHTTAEINRLFIYSEKVR